MSDRNFSGSQPVPFPGGGGHRPYPSAGEAALSAADTHWDASGAGIERYLNILAKRRWLILAITVAAMLIALILTLLSTPVYIAKTTFQVQRDAPRVLDVNAASADTNDDALFFQTQFALIKSRSMAQGVVRRLGLDRNPGFIGERGSFSELFDSSKTVTPAQQQRNFEVATSKVAAGIQAAPYQGSSLIQLTFEDSDPRLAANIANAGVDEFVESTTQRNFAASNYARDFLAKRLEELRTRLEASERDLVNYAAREHIINVSDARNAGQTQSLDSATLTALNTSLATAIAARVQAEQNWRLAQGPSRGTMPQVLADPQLGTLKAKLEALRVDYQQKLKTFKPDFPTMVQLKTEIDTTAAQVKASTGQIDSSLKVAYDLAAAQEKALQAQLATAKGQVLDLQGRSIQYTILQREVDTNRALYDALLQRYKEIGVSGGNGSNNVSIVDRARTPGSPARPILWLNMLIALVGGLGLGLVLSFILDFIDDTFKVPQDVEGKLNLPLLGMIPRLEEGEVPNEQIRDVRSSFAESYFAVRTALQLSSPTGVPRTLLISSASPNEGKSTTAVALAYSFAEQGKRVLLIDADMRRPNLHRTLGQSNAVGLSNVLTGEVTLAAAAIKLEEGFDLVPCGPLPPNPAQLLSTGLRIPLEQGLATYDVIVFDGPPVVGLADAPMLSAALEATILVVEAGKSRRRAVLASLRRLRASRSNIVGVVLTKFDRRDAGYAYAYEYSEFYYSYGGKAAS